MDQYSPKDDICWQPSSGSKEKYRVQGFFKYDYQQEVTERQMRAYGDKPARTERKVRFQLTVTRNEQAITKQNSELAGAFMPPMLLQDNFP